jgi:hypothetical protein
VGYEAGYLLGATSRPVVLLYRRDAAEKISFLITGNTHPNCTLVPYASLADVETFIRSYVGPAHSASAPDDGATS